jgi:hypothetical protein
MKAEQNVNVGQTRRAIPGLRRGLLLVSLLITAVATALITSSGAPAQPSQAGPKTITFVVQPVSEAAPDPSFPHPGDTIVVEAENVRNGQTIGRDYTGCLVTDTAANFQCTVTIGLPGGALEAVYLEAAGAHSIAGALSGGTGRYAGARGSFELRAIGSTGNYNGTLHLLPTAG